MTRIWTLRSFSMRLLLYKFDRVMLLSPIMIFFLMNAGVADIIIKVKNILNISSKLPPKVSTILNCPLMKLSLKRVALSNSDPGGIAIVSSARIRIESRHLRSDDLRHGDLYLDVGGAPF